MPRMHVLWSVASPASQLTPGVGKLPIERHARCQLLTSLLWYMGVGPYSFRLQNDHGLHLPCGETNLFWFPMATPCKGSFDQFRYLVGLACSLPCSPAKRCAGNCFGCLAWCCWWFCDVANWRPFSEGALSTLVCRDTTRSSTFCLKAWLPCLAHPLQK